MLTINRKIILVGVFRNPTIFWICALFKRSLKDLIAAGQHIFQTANIRLWTFGETLSCARCGRFSTVVFGIWGQVDPPKKLRRKTLSAARTQAVRPVGNKNSPILGTSWDNGSDKTRGFIKWRPAWRPAKTPKLSYQIEPGRGSKQCAGRWCQSFQLKETENRTLNSETRFGEEVHKLIDLIAILATSCNPSRHQRTERQTNFYKHHHLPDNSLTRHPKRQQSREGRGVRKYQRGASTRQAPSLSSLCKQMVFHIHSLWYQPEQ